MKHNSGVAGSKQSGSCHAATAGMDVLPLCPLSMAAVPLAGSAVVFHYPRLSQSPMSPGLEQHGAAWPHARLSATPLPAPHSTVSPPIRTSPGPPRGHERPQPIAPQGSTKPGDTV